MAIARAIKKQLANKPHEQRGVRRTAHTRCEPRELKHRGASQWYRRVNGQWQRLVRRPQSQRQRSATDVADAKQHGGSRSYHRFDNSSGDTGATGAERVERRQAPRQQQ
jgi:hypothetical protein